MSHPPLPESSHYSREECISILTDFYNFLSTDLPYIQPSHILHPPNGRWPHIPSQTLSPMNKSPEVINLLAHLPYIRIPYIQDQFPSPEEEWCMIAPRTCLIDFSGESCHSLLSLGKDFNNDPKTVCSMLPPSMETPPHVISLTSGLNHGQWLLLDTSDGERISSTYCRLIYYRD